MHDYNHLKIHSSTGYIPFEIKDCTDEDIITKIIYNINKKYTQFHKFDNNLINDKSYYLIYICLITGLLIFCSF